MDHDGAAKGHPTIAERMASFFSRVRLESIPVKARETAVNDLIDVAGLCVAARETDYVRALIKGWDENGECTAIGHDRPLSAAGAALVNGTATHGEDFDDTLEGAGIRLGAMVIPAVLAAAELHGLSGADALRGIVAGLEVIARVSHVTPGEAQKAGFHHVGVMGVFGSATGVTVALGCDEEQIADALGLAASFSSGLITGSEWTKRIHPGLAAANGYRAAKLARSGFRGPRAVFEGDQSFFGAFTPHAEPQLGFLTDRLGERWLMQDIVFKPYACATTVQPYIDCMIRLAARGIPVTDIVEIVCPTSDQVVARQWEPLDGTRAPDTGYRAKYSAPYAMAVAFYDGDAGLTQFTEKRIRDKEVLKLAAKISYRIDPADPYPENYTGNIEATLRNGSVVTEVQPHMRGGKHQRLTRAELLAKFRGNVAHGRYPESLGERLLEFCLTIADHNNLAQLSEIR